MSESYPSQVIAVAERQARRAGRDFLAGLVESLDFPAALHTRPGPWAACWLDQHRTFSSAQTVVLSTPCVASFDAPSIVRVAVNHYSFDHTRAVCRRLGWGDPRDGEVSSATWRYELSALVEQLPVFVPWVATLVKAKAYREERLLFSPPDACHFWIHPNLLCDYAWSVAAWEANEQERRLLAAREARRRRRRAEGTVARREEQP
jgi:hypothetical protein